MECLKEILIEEMVGLYAVTDITLDGKLFYAAASENRNGKVFIVDSVTNNVTEIYNGLGGVMAIVDVKGENAVLFIEEFYPVFDSATAKIIKVTLAMEETFYKVATREVLAEVPYVHRISLIEEEDGIYVVAGKLCKNKINKDDWSTAGSMEIGKYEPKAKKIEMKQIYDGVFKHHAMFVIRNKAGYDDLYFGGTEGVFVASYSKGRWKIKQLLDIPTSDIAYLDLDQDGIEELAIIEGFHGNKAVIYKDIGYGMERMQEIPLDFGHVLWGGTFLGKPALIIGSRGGDKSLKQYYFTYDALGKTIIESIKTIDEGQAPAQIVVSEFEKSAVIVAANHEAAQMVKYDCHK